MKSGRIPARLSVLFIVLSLSVLPALSLGNEKAPPPRAADEDFFIISSVDVKKQQIVLKRPTEVTELIRVNDKTLFRDEDGKAIELRNLRAGDTVYVAFAAGSEGPRIAASIRKAPMTLDELHRRYVPFQ